MRIIAGKYKGRKLVSGKDHSIRPTTDKVKEFIFNILAEIPEGKTVADIFSGSGSLGLEALSRGAASVVFVEKARSSIIVLKRNIEALNIPEDRYRIVQADAIQFVNRPYNTFDLAFMDPPFVYPPLQVLINQTFSGSFFHKDSLLVLEHETTNPIHLETALYGIIKQKKIGRSLISFIMKREHHE